MTKVKICGLSRPEDVAFVNAAGPDYCGFIVNFPHSLRNVTPEQVRQLRERLSESVTPVGVFVDQPVETVAALQRAGVISIAQLHGHEDEAYVARLRDLTGGKPVWKAFKVRTAADLDAARASSADRVLLDNGYGTGEPFDWTLVRDTGRPWVLAGGLTPENVADALGTLRPWGVDVSGGVETGGMKDGQKIRAFVETVRSFGMPTNAERKEERAI